jgi:hypothetical protein
LALPRGKLLTQQEKAQSEKSCAYPQADITAGVPQGYMNIKNVRFQPRHVVKIKEGVVRSPAPGDNFSTLGRL